MYHRRGNRCLMPLSSVRCAGLSCALWLHSLNRRVLVLEQTATLGGVATRNTFPLPTCWDNLCKVSRYERLTNTSSIWHKYLFYINAFYTTSKLRHMLGSCKLIMRINATPSSHAPCSIARALRPRFVLVHLVH